MRRERVKLAMKLAVFGKNWQRELHLVSFNVRARAQVLFGPLATRTGSPHGEIATMTKVPLLDLTQQYLAFKDALLPELEAMYASQQFILGPKVEALEARLAGYCRSAYACGVTSGSDALLVALMAEKIGHGDEVITTAYSFFATAGAICRVGATPVFVDIDPVTFNIDPAAIEARITPRTRAVIPVHLYGQCADMEAILPIAKKHNLVVIEDACQAIGAECVAGRAGAMGDYGCLSFFPSKNLGAFGDAGMVLTNDPARGERLAYLRNHGMNPKYYHKFVGGNFRMDALQAGVLNIKLKYLDGWTQARQRNAALYDSLFAGCAGVKTPQVMPWCTRHVRNQYIIRILDGKRQQVWDALKAAGIGCDVYYPVPLHLQECFASLGYKAGDFPESERAAKETLAIPIYPDLTEEQIRYVVDTIIRSI